MRDRHDLSAAALRPHPLRGKPLLARSSSLCEPSSLRRAEARGRRTYGTMPGGSSPPAPQRRGP